MGSLISACPGNNASRLVSMKKTNVPWPIKYALAVNIVFAVGFASCAAMAAYLGFAKCYPDMLSRAKELDLQLDTARYALIFIFSTVMWFLPAPLLIYVNRQILRRRRNMKFVQNIISLALLAYFPFGTVLYGIALYFFLLDGRVKDYLKGEPAHA